MESNFKITGLDVSIHLALVFYLDANYICIPFGGTVYVLYKVNSRIEFFQHIIMISICMVPEVVEPKKILVTLMGAVN